VYKYKRNITNVYFKILLIVKYKISCGYFIFELLSQKIFLLFLRKYVDIFIFKFILDVIGFAAKNSMSKSSLFS